MYQPDTNTESPISNKKKKEKFTAPFGTSVLEGIEAGIAWLAKNEPTDITRVTPYLKEQHVSEQLRAAAEGLCKQLKAEVKKLLGQHIDKKILERYNLNNLPFGFHKNHDACIIRTNIAFDKNKERRLCFRLVEKNGNITHQMFYEAPNGHRKKIKDKKSETKALLKEATQLLKKHGTIDEVNTHLVKDETIANVSCQIEHALIFSLKEKCYNKSTPSMEGVSPVQQHTIGLGKYWVRTQETNIPFADGSFFGVRTTQQVGKQTNLHTDALAIRPFSIGNHITLIKRYSRITTQLNNPSMRAIVKFAAATATRAGMVDTSKPEFKPLAL